MQNIPIALHGYQPQVSGWDSVGHVKSIKESEADHIKRK